MSARINYNRITGSNIQGDATTVTEPLGTLVVTNNNELRLHDGTTQGGVAITGGGASGPVFQITSGSYSVSVADTGVVTMATMRGNLEFGALPEIGGPNHFHIMRAPGQDGSSGMDLFFGDDFNYVRQRPAQYGNSPAYGVEIGTYDLSTGTSVQQVWRFGTDGILTVPGGIKSATNTGTVVINSSDGNTTSTWTFGLDGVLTLPPTIGDIKRNGVSVLGSGGLGGFTTYQNSLYTADYGDAYFATFWDSGPGASYLKLPSDTNSTSSAVILSNQLENGAGVSIVASNPRNGNTEYSWNFGSNGELTFPTGGRITSSGKGGTALDGGTAGGWTSLTNYYGSGNYAACVTGYSDGALHITAYNDGGPNPSKDWVFDNNGNLTLPDNSKINAGGINVRNSAEIKTTINRDGSDTSIINTSEIALQAGNGGISAQVYGPWTGGADGSGGPTLVYAGVENLAFSGNGPGFAGFVAIDPAVTSNYSVAIDDNSKIFVNFYDPVTTTGYVAALGVLTSNIDTGTGKALLNGIAVTSTQTALTGNAGTSISTDGGTWQFGYDGKLTLPDGGTLRMATAPTTSKGKSGDKAGMMAVDSTSIFYCIADYVSPYPTETFTISNSGEASNTIMVLMSTNPNYTVPQAGWTTVINGTTMTLSAYSAPNLDGVSYDFIFDQSPDNGVLPSTAIFVSNVAGTEADIWVKQAWGTTGSW